MRRESSRNQIAREDLLLTQRFDARSIDRNQVVDCINDIYSRANLMVSTLPSVGVPVDTRSTYWDLENIKFLRSYSHGHFGQITGPMPLIGIRKYFSGFVRLIFEDTALSPEPGDILITDFRHIAAFEVRQLDSLTVVLPVDLLDLDLSRVKLPWLIRAGSLECRLLSSALEAVQDELTEVRRSEAHIMESTIVGLVRGILQHGPVSDERGFEVTKTRSRAIRSYINEQLGRTDLGIAHICSFFNTSRSAVYREFEKDGGLARYITHRRLETALNAIVTGPQSRGRISEVALSVGYSDPFHFSRAFRKFFGFPPSDALDLARQISSQNPASPD